MNEQYFIFTLSLAAAWLVNDPRPNVRRFGCLFGLAGQPFWIYSAFIAAQWGIFAMSFFYTAMWLRGFYHQWIRPS